MIDYIISKDGKSLEIHFDTVRATQEDAMNLLYTLQQTEFAETVSGMVINGNKIKRDEWESTILFLIEQRNDFYKSVAEGSYSPIKEDEDVLLSGNYYSLSEKQNIEKMFSIVIECVKRKDEIKEDGEESRMVWVPIMITDAGGKVINFEAFAIMMARYERNRKRKHGQGKN